VLAAVAFLSGVATRQTVESFGWQAGMKHA
jgi:hypothetical protein